jgi:hypothetical protein
MIWDTIGMVASFLVASYLLRRNVHRSLSLHSDVEKGLPDDQVPAYSPSLLANGLSSRDSSPPKRHIENASPRTLGRFFTLHRELSPGKHPSLPKQKEGLKRVKREPRLRRARQYCCKCSRFRKYLSDKLCTCGHKRCEGCFKGRQQSAREVDVYPPADCN